MSQSEQTRRFILLAEEVFVGNVSKAPEEGREQWANARGSFWVPSCSTEHTFYQHLLQTHPQSKYLEGGRQGDACLLLPCLYSCNTCHTHTHTYKKTPAHTCLLLQHLSHIHSHIQEKTCSHLPILLQHLSHIHSHIQEETCSHLPILLQHLSHIQEETCSHLQA